MRNLVALVKIGTDYHFMHGDRAVQQLTPKGQSVMFRIWPVHAGLVGGAAANVSPATVQVIGQAAAVIVSGGSPESKIGEGNFPPAGVPALNLSVEGSIAYCQSELASNSRSTARGSCAFRVRTFSVRGISKA